MPYKDRMMHERRFYLSINTAKTYQIEEKKKEYRRKHNQIALVAATGCEAMN